MRKSTLWNYLGAGFRKPQKVSRIVRQRKEAVNQGFAIKQVTTEVNSRLIQGGDQGGGMESVSWSCPTQGKLWYLYTSTSAYTNSHSHWLRCSWRASVLWCMQPASWPQRGLWPPEKALGQGTQLETVGLRVRMRHWQELLSLWSSFYRWVNWDMKVK